MSKAPKMESCPQCKGGTLPIVREVRRYDNATLLYRTPDVCERCGGSGRVAKLPRRKKVKDHGPGSRGGMP